MPRCYLGVWAVPLALLGWLVGQYGDTTMVCVSLHAWRVHSAMVQHWSQYVWFRRLYVLVSRYVWVNELVCSAFCVS